MPTNSNNETISAHDEGEDLPRNVALTSPVAPEQVVASPTAYRPYCLNCEKEGHRTRECHSTYMVGARSNEIDLLAASPEAAPPTSTGEWTPPTVEQVEHELGMGHGAWDMEDPEGIIRAVLRLATPPAATPAAPSAVHSVSIPLSRITQMAQDIQGATRAEHSLAVLSSFLVECAALAQPAPVQAGAQQAVTEPIAFALKWPGETCLNLSTVFDTETEANSYLERCSPGVVVVPLCAALAAPTQAGAGDAKGETA